MAGSSSDAPSDDRGSHAAARLPGLSIDSYNLELCDGDAFVGDRASQSAFRELLEERRRHQRTGDADPFGDTPSAKLSKKTIDEVLRSSDEHAAHLVHGAVEDYARRLVGVVRQFLDSAPWRGVQHIVFGGGMQEGAAGRLAIARAQRLSREAGIDIDYSTLRHDPDDGGLLGWAQLAPEATLRAGEAFLAVDIGGTNIRCGIVAHRRDATPDRRHAEVMWRNGWRHAEDRPVRDEAVMELAGMLNGLVAQARTTGIRLAPFVGIACPGAIRADGGIARGGQNLPGDWEADGFNLPRALRERLDRIDGSDVQVVMHNDAVVQGLSERARMRRLRRWGVLTIGTGLGNASYTNLRPADDGNAADGA
ncbi:ROK family protein [Coralloluteibacterium stylophorae]|uniref:ROK family protein n=1 Tax=Coralloluteibacterium stylophorae TaxID=1776034 RepID=A0A8J8AZ83_9GAMM|nr:ROK family protein [Coralloluteibacterium stylophorae]MBS7456823.1 ROK family protein [Coralloluteibacterium stylophorae]